jgi:hypothetical protein
MEKVFLGISLRMEKKIVYGKAIKQIRQFWLLDNFLPERKQDK